MAPRAGADALLRKGGNPANSGCRNGVCLDVVGRAEWNGHLSGSRAEQRPAKSTRQGMGAAHLELVWLRNRTCVPVKAMFRAERCSCIAEDPVGLNGSLPPALSPQTFKRRVQDSFGLFPDPESLGQGLQFAMAVRLQRMRPDESDVLPQWAGSGTRQRETAACPVFPLARYDPTLGIGWTVAEGPHREEPRADFIAGVAPADTEDAMGGTARPTEHASCLPMRECQGHGP